MQDLNFKQSNHLRNKKLESAAINKATEKRIDQMKSDLRQMILLGATKNAQVAVALDKFIHLSELVGQFYTDLAGGEENAAEIQRVRQIQSTLRTLAEQNADTEEKRYRFI